MTCREQYKIDYPENVKSSYLGGCCGCPHEYYPVERKTNCNADYMECAACWNREIPGTEPKEDVVNHPNHYTNGGMECIDEMILIFGKEAVANFCLCNAWKYRYRAMYKNGEEDMKKSHWYMAKYKELIESYGKAI